MSTQLLINENNNGTDHASLKLVRDGVAGNKDVVKQMVRLIRDSVTDKGLSDYAAHILLSNNLTSDSPARDQFQAIYDNVKNGNGKDFKGVKYVNDPAGEVESIKSARQTLADGYGDCDDYAVLISSLLAALGFNPVLILAKYDNDPNSPYGHIYTTVFSDDERFVFDPVIPNGNFNDEVKPLQSFSVGVFDTHAGIDSLGAIASNAIRNTKRSVQTVAHISKNVLPFASFFFPQVSPAAAFASFIPSKSSTNLDTSNFQQAAKLYNSELNRAIENAHKGLITVKDAKQTAANIQSAINNVKVDTQNEIIIKDSIQQRINSLNAFQNENEISNETFMYVTLGVTGLALVWAFSNRKWLSQYV